MGENETKGFTSKIGYVMAVAGSAVGLGNIWRFPYLAAKYGGGIFLLIYLLLAVTFGFSLLVSETAIGRKTGNGPIQAFIKLTHHKFPWGGWLNALIPMLIIPYYCVVGGWVCKYLFEYAMGNSAALLQNDYFSNFMSSSVSPIIWLFIFIALVAAVVVFGVQKGVERVSKILMPSLVIVALGLAIYTMTIPGAMEGVKYYILPDFSKFTLMTVVSAMGQMFYSLSIGMGILITYGSYMKKDTEMEKSISQIEIMDTLIAFLAGLMIIPAVFVFSGGNPDSLQAGPSLMFITMPKIFASMPFGQLVGLFFFLLVFFAALTSAISLMECCVATIKEQFDIQRVKACIFMLVEVLILGIPCSLGFGILDYIKPLGMSIFDAFDFMTNSVMMPISASYICFVILKTIGLKQIIDEVEMNGVFKRKAIYTFCMKYIVIPGLMIILTSSILNALGMISM